MTDPAVISAFSSLQALTAAGSRNFLEEDELESSAFTAYIRDFYSGYWKATAIAGSFEAAPGQTEVVIDVSKTGALSFSKLQCSDVDFHLAGTQRLGIRSSETLHIARGNYDPTACSEKKLPYIYDTDIVLTQAGSVVTNTHISVFAPQIPVESTVAVNGEKLP